MPAGAQILSVQAQRGLPKLWALVDEQAEEKVPRDILTVGTGHPILELLGPFIGTYQMEGGALVWHVFEVQERYRFKNDEQRRKAESVLHVESGGLGGEEA